MVSNSSVEKKSKSPLKRELAKRELQPE